jgi:single-strand DNA-binding protein
VQRMNRGSKNDGFTPDAPQDDAWSIAASAPAVA